ncbi:MAG TPA: neutral zinc metallopeptidase [bacterium]|nr:neutral zinc metallopeptidase [bacterium]HOC26229.1 neutral zinc metallopeptidase [bacterium]HOH08073.1 neutral zinc metallopeptidase [bacterium]HOY44967.1 neutral zinc metallopeptidase [bacterium]HPG83738.1 neutral zinc metallopeptidase [bacterium]
MRWQGRTESENVEDRRGTTSRRVIGGGIGTLVILLLVWLLGGDPMQFLQENPGVSTSTPVSTEERSAEENQLASFVKVVLKDTEDVWGKLFQNAGSQYRMPTLVLYTDQVQSACGYGSAATGPFYCPGDEKVYIDLAFCAELQNQYDAPGDFAIAYVIAHEVGHHVQNLLGITDQIASMQGRVSQEEYNQYSIRLELQADFFAGVWAHHAQKMNNILEPGDLDEAINAASAVGDDRIMRRTQGYVVPDAFTHGTSDQRQRWFKKGWDTGDPNQGDTFAARTL